MTEPPNPPASAPTPRSLWRRTRQRGTGTPKSPRSDAWCVYAITDPRSDAMFYVGQTRRFARRKAEHLEGTDQISGLVIGQIIAAGFLPQFTVLERALSEEAALRAEIFWIELLLGRGVSLVNSQAFDGFPARRAKRCQETEKLAAMQRLKALANGRPVARTAARSRQPKAARRSPEQPPRQPSDGPAGRQASRQTFPPEPPSPAPMPRGGRR